MILLIKLNAIDSTNEFLKRWVEEHSSESAVAALAAYQEQGKGQRGNQWVSEPSKNLALSVYIPLSGVLAVSQFSLTKLISLTVIEVLEELKIPELAIKWPNDILSCQQKIGGILIETAIKKNSLEYAIVGMGLNVNQLVFDGLPKAASMASVTGKNFQVDTICQQILDRLEAKFPIHFLSDSSELDQAYLSYLFQYQKSAQYMDSKGNEFEATLVGVAPNGKLQLKTAAGIQSFLMKEITFIW
jgi:BirA family biotin operon repressor/biotin-[acetyl-CoA-carboxylase] ligase